MVQNLGDIVMDYVELAPLIGSDSPVSHLFAAMGLSRRSRDGRKDGRMYLSPLASRPYTSSNETLLR